MLRMDYVGPRQVYLVGAVDLVGDKAEHTVADQLDRCEKALEANPHIRKAVLSLSTPRRSLTHSPCERSVHPPLSHEPFGSRRRERASLVARVGRL